MATRRLKVQPDSLREYEQLINSYNYVATLTCKCQLVRDSFILSNFSVCTLNYR